MTMTGKTQPKVESKSNANDGRGNDDETKALTKSSKSGNDDRDDKTSSKNEEEDLPADVAATKAKLEAETGKKYKYRPRSKDLPSISHMLAHGAPESKDRPRTWMETVGYPLLLLVLFYLSLLVFQQYVKHFPARRKPHRLPVSRDRQPLWAQHRKAREHERQHGDAERQRENKQQQHQQEEFREFDPPSQTKKAEVPEVQKVEL